MAQNTDTIDYRNDYYKGFAGIYFRKILDTIIKFGGLKNEAGVILDFGCGVGHLKKMLKKENIIGYDIEKELTEIDDYKKLSPKVIVLSGVLEHIHLENIEKLLDEFLIMNPRVELLVYLPTENLISKIAMRLAGQKHAHDDHVSRYKDIDKMLEKKFQLNQRKYILFRMAEVSCYLPKKYK
jgi:hypothetical protein